MSLPPILLHVQPAEGEPFEHRWLTESLVVGRAMDVDLSLADPFLSRRHSRLFRSGTALFVEDLGSRNGTLLNGQPIEAPAEVRPGDVVTVSGSSLTVTERPPAGPPADDALDGTVFRRAAELISRDQAQQASALEDEAELRRFAERLKLLNEVHQALGRSLARSELLELILDRVFDHLRPDRGAILLRETSGAVRPAARRPAADAAELPVSQSLVREVLDKGMAALVLDVHTDERFAGAASMLLSGVRSLVAAPLLAGDATLGLIVLESRAGARQFAPEDLELLVSLAAVAALHLKNLELALEAAERRRLEEELALARRIQIALLPDRLPEIPGWELWAGNTPSRGVSGDYFEIVERGGEAVFIVADVSGKGMAASLLTASLQAFAAGPIEDGLPPEEIAVRLSRLLFRRTPPEKYATAVVAVLDAASGIVRYTNAGHNQPLLLRAGGDVEELPSNGVPLGLLPAAAFTAAEVRLGPGDTLLLYTDGIVEAFNPDDAEYGLDRLKEIAARYRESSPEALGAALDRDLVAFAEGVPFADDRTVVIVRRVS